MSHTIVWYCHSDLR